MINGRDKSWENLDMDFLLKTSLHYYLEARILCQKRIVIVDVVFVVIWR